MVRKSTEKPTSSIDKQFYKKELSFRQEILRRIADPEDEGLKSV